MVFKFLLRSFIFFNFSLVETLHASEQSIALKYPLQASVPCRINSSYNDPTLNHKFKGRRKHAGVDFGGRRRTYVVAAHNGWVHQVQDQFVGYGNSIILRNCRSPHTSDCLLTRYAHLDSILVQQGNRVKTGDKIGRMGSTGSVRGNTGVHLHFEVLTGNPSNKRWRSQDPLPLLNDSVKCIHTQLDQNRPVTEGIGVGYVQ